MPRPMRSQNGITKDNADNPASPDGLAGKFTRSYFLKSHLPNTYTTKMHIPTMNASELLTSSPSFG